MAAPTIPNGETQFIPILYEGNGTAQRVGKFVPFTDNGTIANSVIFNDDDNAYLSRTNDAGDRDTFTISVWVKRCALDAVQHIFDTYDGSSSNDGYIRFNADNTISTRIGSPSSHLYTTRREFNDTSKWYHIVLSVNTGDSTAADRVKLYIDGDRITSFSTQTNAGSSDDTQFNYSSATFRIGSTTGGSYDLDGYLAEFNQVDGTALTPDTFGITNTSSGRWVPKALTGITYGTNGFRLQFGSSSNFGDDTSGNTNDFSVSNLVAGDQTTDSPTQNFATLSGSRVRGSISLSEGNLKITSTSTNYAASATTFRFSETASTGLYFEVKNVGSSQGAMSVLIMRNSVAVSSLSSDQQFTDCFGLISRGGGGGNTYWTSENGSNGYDTSVSHASNDYIQVAFKEGKVWFGINNTWIGSGNPSTGANPTYNNISGQDFRFLMTAYQNNELECNFGQKAFNYTLPTGFVAVQQDNMATTDKGVSGLTWTKDRDATASWMCIDSSRIYTAEGVPAASNLDNTNREYGQVDFVDGINKFLKGGFAVATSNNSYSYINKSGNANVSYSWVGNGGTTASNSDGSITSSVQANTTAGFSIVTYTGTGSNATVGHGLSSAPEWMIIKQRSADGEGWSVYHKSFTSAAYIATINNTNAPASSATDFNSTAPTSTVFSVGTNARTNASSATYVAYCWHGVDGFSKFGKYVGNGTDTDGPFIYTGFTPSFIIFKANRITNWYSHDGARNPANPVTIGIDPNTTAAEYNGGAYVGNGLDFVSNGFKIRQATGLGYNYTGEEIYYMAFAKQSFLGDGTNPGTAR